MLLNSRQFKFLKNYRNVNVKLNAKREYRDENVFLKGDRALSKLITLLIRVAYRDEKFSFFVIFYSINEKIFQTSLSTVIFHTRLF